MSLPPLAVRRPGKPLVDMRRTRVLMEGLIQPQTVSKVGLAVHWGLAAIKLPAAIISGSIGLLNDSLDTLLDGISSLVVYFGIRFDKERAVDIVLVLLMLPTGIFTIHEAVRRLFVPFEPEVDWFTFLATILSAVVCAGLWGYQRYIGLRSGSLALITQSVDSRNHIIVAGGVTAGLVASLLRFPLLDTLVGLAVVVLILKAALELAIDFVRSFGEGEVDLSRYRFGIAWRYEHFRRVQLCDWMLYLVEKEGARTRSELVKRAREALDFGRNPMLRELGLTWQPRAGGMIEQGLAELFERGLLVEEKLSITEAGRKHLQRSWSRERS